MKTKVHNGWGTSEGHCSNGGRNRTYSLISGKESGSGGGCGNCSDFGKGLGTGRAVGDCTRSGIGTGAGRNNFVYGMKI